MVSQNIDVSRAQYWDLDSLYSIAFDQIGIDAERAKLECNKYYEAVLFLKDTVSLPYAYDLKALEAYNANYLDSTFYFSDLAIDLFLDLNDSAGLSAAYYNRGLYHSYVGEFNTSLRYLNLGRGIDIDWGYKIDNDIFFYEQVSTILYEQEQFDLSLRYLEKAWRAYYGTKGYYSYFLPQLHLASAWLYNELGVSEMAVYHAKKTYALTSPDSSIIERGSALEVLALEAAKAKDTATALAYAASAHELAERNDDPYIHAYNHIFLLDFYLRISELAEAKESYDYLMEIGDLFSESPSYSADRHEVLYKYTKAINEKDLALMHLEKFQTLKIAMIEFDGTSAMTQFDKEMEEKAKALLDTQLELKEQELKEQRLYIIGGIVLVLGFTVFALFLLIANRNKDRRNKKLIAQKELIEKQQNEIIHQKEILEASNQKLELLNQSKDKLFSILAHDLRQPFNQILGIIELIEMGAINDEDKAQLQKDLKASVQGTSDLVNNMLLWSKAQFAGVSLKTVDIELSEALKRSLLYYSVAFKKKDIKVAFHVPDNLTIRFDQDHFESVVRNILSNAYKFSPAHSTISIIAEEAPDNRVCLKIKDEGIGMDQYQIDRILNGKGGVSETGTYNETGVGIGMVIVKDFLAENDARLEIESKINEGSTFCINIPAAKKQKVLNPST